MRVELRQGGRAAMDFMVGITAASRLLVARWGTELAVAGITADSLPDDIDARHNVIDAALAGSTAFSVTNLVMEFASVEHGRVAAAGFDEMADVLLPRLAALEAQGPATLTVADDLVVPDYYKDVWFHRTTGGWNGHPEMGFVHSEFTHKPMSRAILAAISLLSAALGLLSRADYSRICEMGTSSGHFTTALQKVFPAADITGVELALPMLREAPRVANAHGWAWDLHQAAAEATGFDAERFDLVASHIILHGMPAAAIAATFAEAFRLLKPGGQMLMSDVAPYRMLDKLGAWRADAGAKKGGESYWRETASLDLGSVARDAGFVDVREGGLGGALYPWVTIGTKPGAAM